MDFHARVGEHDQICTLAVLATNRQ